MKLTGTPVTECKNKVIQQLKQWKYFGFTVFAVEVNKYQALFLIILAIKSTKKSFDWIK